MPASQLTDPSTGDRAVPRRPADPPARPSRGRFRSAGVALAPAVLLLVLGVIQLERHLAAWYDEDYTLLAVQTPIDELVAAVRHASPLVSWLTVAPSFNAPWYVLMHGWAAVFGASPTALRVPALLCSAAAVGVLALVVRRVAGDLAGLTAGVLAAAGPSLAQQAVEARSYGAAELAIALTALCLVRHRQQGASLVPLGLAAGAAGLMHWFALPVLVGFGLWSLVDRRGAEAVTIAVASLPALALIVVQVLGGGDGTPITQHVGLLLGVHALLDWSKGGWWLTVALVVAFVVALVRSSWRRMLAGWVVAPLLLVTALEALRPVYFGRYLLFTLLGLAAGAAIGAASIRHPWWRAVACAALVALSLITCVPRLQAHAREHPEQVVALLEAEQRPGQPVAAADGRAALELAEQVRTESSPLAGDLLLRPAHVPVGGPARVAWVVRSASPSGDAIPASPDDAFLSRGGWRPGGTRTFHGAYGDLLVQRWIR